jgi:FemAB-related protein (PEP-CTERM system-associated)
MGVSFCSQYRIRQADDKDSEKWDAYVNSNSCSKIYHLFRWKRLIEEFSGHKGVYFVALDSSDQICGILPLFHMKSLLFGRFAISVPYFNYGGPLGNSPEIEEALISEASTFFDDANIDYLEFREIKKRDAYPCKTEKVTMILPLESEAELMMKGFKAKLRSQIKRPIRENVTIEFGGIELLNEFYSVFTANMRDLGTPPYSKNLFAEILKNFSDRSFVAIARKDKKPVGGAFLIGYKDTLEIPWASTLKKHNRIGVNMLMYWEIIKKAIEDNYSFFDFGRCTKDAGTYKFKKQWGTEEVPLYWNYSLKNISHLPEVNPNNPKYDLFIKTWRKLPIVVTRMVGPSIVRNIP